MMETQTEEEIDVSEMLEVGLGRIQPCTHTWGVKNKDECPDCIYEAATRVWPGKICRKLTKMAMEQALGLQRSGKEREAVIKLMLTENNYVAMKLARQNREEYLYEKEKRAQEAEQKRLDIFDGWVKGG